ncbi:MAG: hypothetical protein WC729_03620 [Sphingomonas sp.]|uniref:hypothetical protein n=1 Tax=Sphingomonas sp. TaxID=28214 RepID=UPI0035663383
MLASNAPLIGVIEVVVTAVLTLVLSRLLRGQRAGQVVALAGGALPFIIFAAPLVLMLLPGAGPGEGMLLALAMVVAGVSLPVCLGAAAVTSMLLRRNSRIG